MFRLFQEIRQQEATGNNSLTFWAYAIGEFVLLVLGILIALQIENWNQHRQDKKLEKVLLTEMLLNLKTDLKDVESNLEFHNRVKRSNEIILQHIVQNKPYHDSLALHFGLSGGSTIFKKNTSAYESMKSIGIDIISNDNLRQQITYLYSVQYNYIQEFQVFDINYTIEHLINISYKHFDLIEMWKSAQPINYEELKKDQEYKEHLKLHIFNREFIVSQYEHAKALIETLIKDIEEEI